MSRVITFSRQFPTYHSQAGKPTYFVEKIWKGLWDAEPSIYVPFNGYWQWYDQTFPSTGDPKENIHDHDPKWHTIRAGNRWKAGDTFSPRVWTGKPYCSKQLAIAPDIEIKTVMSFEIQNNSLFVDGEELTAAQWIELAQNDGLSISDMLAWLKYPKPFSGQILCWSPDVHY